MALPLISAITALTCAVVGFVFFFSWGVYPLFAAAALATPALRASGAEHGLARKLGWAGLGLGLFGGLSYLTLLGADNIKSNGIKNSERMAVANLRTLLWAQDNLIELRGQPGDLDQLMGRAPLSDGTTSPTILLPTKFTPRHAEQGPRGISVAAVDGYMIAVYVSGQDGVPAGAAPRWMAYAWPARQGVSGLKAYCISAEEDIFQTENTEQRYEGLARIPDWTACLQGGFFDRPKDGRGGDGVDWVRWRKKGTRRSKAADAR